MTSVEHLPPSFDDTACHSHACKQSCAQPYLKHSINPEILLGYHDLQASAAIRLTASGVAVTVGPLKELLNLHGCLDERLSRNKLDTAWTRYILRQQRGAGANENANQQYANRP